MLSRVRFCTLGDIWHSLEMFLLVIAMGRGYWHLGVKVRNLRMYRIAPSVSYVAQNQIVQSLRNPHVDVSVYSLM